MNVAELFKAMSNSVDRVHLFLADGGPLPSSLGTYEFNENWKPGSNAWAILDTKNGIPERYHSYKVTSFYLYEGSDGSTVIDIGISEHEEENDTSEWRTGEDRGSPCEVCIKCGGRAVYRDRFCPNCGRPMTNGY